MPDFKAPSRLYDEHSLTADDIQQDTHTASYLYAQVVRELQRLLVSFPPRPMPIWRASGADST
jgi:hypothetical protein